MRSDSFDLRGLWTFSTPGIYMLDQMLSISLVDHFTSVVNYPFTVDVFTTLFYDRTFSLLARFYEDHSWTYGPPLMDFPRLSWT